MSRLKLTGRYISGTVFAVMMGTAGAAESVLATLSRLEGIAMVNQRTRHVDGWKDMELKKGDRIMVEKKGHKATISFDDGCDYTLEEGEVLTIGDVSTCASTCGKGAADPYQLVSRGLTRLAPRVWDAAESVVATLSQLDGVAIVDEERVGEEGRRFFKGLEDMKLRRGDRVAVKKGGKATLSFEDGCDYTLEDYEVLTIGAASTCASACVLGAKDLFYKPDLLRCPGIATTSTWAIPAGVAAGLGVLGGGLPRGSEDRLGASP